MAQVRLYKSPPSSPPGKWGQRALVWICDLAAKHGGVTVSSRTLMPTSALRAAGTIPCRPQRCDTSSPTSPLCSWHHCAFASRNPTTSGKTASAVCLTPVTLQETLFLTPARARQTPAGPWHQAEPLPASLVGLNAEGSTPGNFPTSHPVKVLCPTAPSTSAPMHTSAPEAQLFPFLLLG